MTKVDERNEMRRKLLRDMDVRIRATSASRAVNRKTDADGEYLEFVITAKGGARPQQALGEHGTIRFVTPKVRRGVI